MKLVKSVKEVRQFVLPKKYDGKSIGLVTTMGYLHEGHESLIQAARKENDLVVVSIFVNPTQFGEGEDLDDYPRDLEKDLEACRKLGVDLVFNPEVENMYSNPKSYVDIEDLSNFMCGKSRPTHFRGVCTVVTKLFNIVQPDRAYFGEKDAQQLLIIKKMVKDLDFNLEVVACPTLREDNGLAKSSRNKYLTDEEKEKAALIFKSLEAARKIIKPGISSESIKHEIKNILKKEEELKIDYIEIVDFEELQPIDTIEDSALIALAVYLGQTRLIDNLIYEVR